ncbi:unnamed protein product, partial [Hapterophycus canaliculatus]
MGTRAMLARARVGDARAGCYKWLSHCPLYRLLDFTRPESWGDIVPTSENSSKVSPTRRHRHFVKSALELSNTKDQDWGVFRILVDGYEPVASDKKNEVNAHENSLSRLGNGSKKDKGRLFDVQEWNNRVDWMGDLVEKNGIRPIMDKIGDVDRQKEVVAMCLEVLHDKGGKLLGKRENEDHLYPVEYEERIDEVINVLSGAGVSAQDLEMFSCALHILDSLTAACLRPPDSLWFPACKAHRKRGKLVFVLPPVGKNSNTLVKSVLGMVVNHTKADRTAGAYAVMIVIGRRLMRIRLQENFAAAKANERKNAEENLKVAVGTKEVTVAQSVLEKAKTSVMKASREVKLYAPRNEENDNDEERLRTSRGKRKTRLIRFAEPWDKVCPFTEYGKSYDGRQLRDLYQSVGEYGLGLPAFGPNILRTIHVTLVMNVCYQLGTNQSDDRVLNRFALGRHWKYEMRKAYNLAKADNSNHDPNPFSAQTSGVI